MHKYTFAQSRLQNLVVEYVTKTKTILYISDGGMRSIIVYYVQSNDGYRIKLPHSVMCGNKPLQDVLYMVMIEQQTGTYIYFTYLFSDDIFRIKTKDMLKTMHLKSIVNMGKLGIVYFIKIEYLNVSLFDVGYITIKEYLIMLLY